MFNLLLQFRKKNSGFLKVIFLTVITFGLYGAWYALRDIAMAPDTNEGISEEQKKALEAQRALETMWIMQTFNKP